MYELVLLWEGGSRRFCPLVFNVRVWDGPPVVDDVALALLELYTGERRREFVDDVGIDVGPVAAVVVEESLLSEGWSKHCEATEKQNRYKNNRNPFHLLRLVDDEVWLQAERWE